MKRFASNTAIVPSGVEAEDFRIRVLTISDVVKDYDAKVILWVRQSAVSDGLDEKLFSTVKRWLSDKWWFTAIAFPGRSIGWHEWESLPAQRDA